MYYCRAINVEIEQDLRRRGEKKVGDENINS
jgi:hypothetical protein